MNPLRLIESGPDLPQSGVPRDARVNSASSTESGPGSGAAVREPNIGPGSLIARSRRSAGPRDAVRAILRENRLASTLDADDARLIFAQRVAQSLDGGSAAILTPERRQRALRLARMLGMRPFDASLVVAIVQDNARRAVPTALLGADSRLVMIAPPSPRAAGNLAAARGPAWTSSFVPSCLRALAPLGLRASAPRRRIFIRLWLAAVLAISTGIFGALLLWLLR